MSLTTIKKTVANADKKVSEFIDFLHQKFPSNGELIKLLSVIQKENKIQKEKDCQQITGDECNEAILKIIKHDIQNQTSMNFIKRLHKNVKILETPSLILICATGTFFGIKIKTGLSASVRISSYSPNFF